ncbi:MAG: aminoacetone oxidase family FAD-binding enzyme [Ruminococcus sp.]|nr:aminoacetone oxidase family FAD-binding enzyme [Ruminococcus sp.]
MENRIKADIAIVGGGASGLAAAIGAAGANATLKVVIAERLDKTGRKILATGNGRCNLSNRNLSGKAYHGSVNNVMDVIAETPSAEEFFGELGVLCTSDEQGRIYPYSSSAASVLNALRIRSAALGVKEVCGFEVKSIEKKNGRFLLRSEDREIECSRVIIAAGGYAAPSFGTDGGMMRLFREKGYRTAKICPAVAPFKVSREALKGLKGVRVKGKIAALSDGKVLREEYGEIQFTESTVSGICVFNLAYLMSQYEGRLSLRADLMPEMSVKKLEEYLFSVQYQRYDCTLEELLTGIFVKNLAVYLVKRAVGRPLTDKISALKYGELHRLAELIKSLEFEVTGSSPWQNAQVTSGGIHGSCINARLESKLDRGVYFAGEILDVDGDCGGYNLQWAWSSGLLAGRSCAESLKTGAKNDQDK